MGLGEHRAFGKVLKTGSQGGSGTVVFELAGQHASIQLVELHQLQQIAEARVSVIQTVEQLTVILHLTHTCMHNTFITIMTLD